MYNPFKAHLAQLHNGKYVVRKSALFFWVYLDSTKILSEDPNFWWSSKNYVKTYCICDTIQEAEARLTKYCAKPPQFSKKV